MHHVVCIHACNVGASHVGKRGVQGRHEASSLTGDMTKPGVLLAHVLRHSRAAVVGTIVHDEAFPVGQALAGDAAKAGAEGIRGVVDGQQDGGE